MIEELERSTRCVLQGGGSETGGETSEADVNVGRVNKIERKKRDVRKKMDSNDGFDQYNAKRSNMNTRSRVIGKEKAVSYSKNNSNNVVSMEMGDMNMSAMSSGLYALEELERCTNSVIFESSLMMIDDGISIQRGKQKTEKAKAPSASASARKSQKTFSNDGKRMVKESVSINPSSIEMVENLERWTQLVLADGAVPAVDLDKQTENYSSGHQNVKKIEISRKASKNKKLEIKTRDKIPAKDMYNETIQNENIPLFSGLLALEELERCTNNVIFESS